MAIWRRLFIILGLFVSALEQEGKSSGFRYNFLDFRLKTESFQAQKIVLLALAPSPIALTLELQFWTGNFLSLMA